MVFTRQKSRAGENPDSSPRNNPETNIREICTTSHTLFIHKYNELFIEQVIQCFQDVADDELHFFCY